MWMLRPQRGPHREFIDLSGVWRFRLDPDDRGLADGWVEGVPGARPIGVPGSWNDQVVDGRRCLGPAWYETEFTQPVARPGHATGLRFGGVNDVADVFVDGERLGGHDGGHLPFAVPLTPAESGASRRLVVRVDGRVRPDGVPGGDLDGGWFSRTNEPPTQYDFFPFCGIHRPVHVVSVPADGIAEIEVTTTVDAGAGAVNVAVSAGAGEVRVVLSGHGVELEAFGSTATLRVPDPALWGPGHPDRYRLEIELVRDGVRVDSYRLMVGIRSIRIEDDELLLNGRPVFLRGFGRHEDFPVVGRGIPTAVMVADHELMAWTGANSYRTTHYPYAEEQLDLADELGFLVIGETAAVSVVLGDEHDPARLERALRCTEEMIRRDRNHPSVIAWSLANEPFIGGDPLAFLGACYERARRLDPTRPVLHVGHMYGADDALGLADIICTNRYEGWYTDSGRLDDGFVAFARELDALRERYGKPVMVTEFGADTLAGHHSISPEVWSEEYQWALIEGYLDVIAERPWVVGAHVWNLCDFATGQGVTRARGLNHKGVFTRDRRPKLAAGRLRDRWTGAVT